MKGMTMETVEKFEIIDQTMFDDKVYVQLPDEETGEPQIIGMSHREVEAGMPVYSMCLEFDTVEAAQAWVRARGATTL
jgi:hypothetical protein